jgi:hypothetical protein
MAADDDDGRVADKTGDRLSEGEDLIIRFEEGGEQSIVCENSSGEKSIEP